jgi:endoglucanase
MKKSYLLILSFTGLFVSLFSQPSVKVNQAGYLPGMPKYAFVNDIPEKEFSWSIRRSSDNQVLLNGTCQSSGKNDPSSGEKVTRIDFSTLNEKGSYYLDIEDIATSYEFSISDDVFRDIWSAGIKSYYYQRSGMDLSPRYAGMWSRKASHPSDGVL